VWRCDCDDECCDGDGCGDDEDQCGNLECGMVTTVGAVTVKMSVVIGDDNAFS
jgi:hypothetical protein